MISLHHADCFDIFHNLPDQSVDLVIADLPFGVTRCDWDCKIDLDLFWNEMRRIVKSPTGSVIMFGTQPFTSDLIMANRKMFKYEMIWQKHRPTGFQHCKQRVLSSHENVLLFSEGVTVGKHRSTKQMTYNPQGLVKFDKPRVRKAEHRMNQFAGRSLPGSVQTHTNWPRSVLTYNSVHKPQHPTQKPTDLLAYLIETFSHPGDVILDPTMGAGSTGVAAKQTGRAFIGIEMDHTFYDIARKRIDETEAPTTAEHGHDLRSQLPDDADLFE